METRRTKLTLAVKLVDAVTDGRPTTEHGRPSVHPVGAKWLSAQVPAARYPQVTLRIAGTTVSAIRNRSGFDLFLDVAIPEDTTPTLEVDGGRRYLNETRPVVAEHLSPLRPIPPGEEPEGSGTADSIALLDDVRTWREDSQTYHEIRLRPSPAYRFPPGMTLLRGHVQDLDGKRLSGVTLTIEELDRTTETTQNGEFVIYITNLTATDVTDDGFVQFHGADPQVTVEHNAEESDGVTSWGTDTVSLTADEGQTCVYRLTYTEQDSVTADDITSPRRGPS